MWDHLFQAFYIIQSFDSIATCGSDKKIRLWRSSSLTHLSTIDIVSESVSIKFNKDGTKITDGSRVGMWKMEA